MVMPSCLGLSGSVRTVANPRLQNAAPLVHTFCPLTSQPPSVLVARVRIPAASEPAPGSLNSWHHTYSCSRLRRIHRSIWSSSACWVMVWMTQPPIPYCGRFTPAAASSSSITSCSTALAARPHGFGQCASA